MTLDELGLKHGTDKASTGHDYCKIYEHYLAPLRGQSFTLLELGVGGEAHRDRGGQSLRMWAEYFPEATIVGLDVHEKELTLPGNVRIFHGSQDDPDRLVNILSHQALPTVIIDDASHHNVLTVRSFELLFPGFLKRGGLYLCEDVHTSYWKENYGGHPDPCQRGTAMGFFQKLTAQLNHATLLSEYRDQYAGMLEYVHFYPELVAIKKLP